MKTMICLAGFLALVGCASVKVRSTEIASVEEFSSLIAKGSNHEIGTAMTQFFKVGDPVSNYYEIIPLANQTFERDYGPEYFFWFRGRNPKIEGDYWVQVAVDKGTQTIKRVLINGYTK